MSDPASGTGTAHVTTMDINSPDIAAEVNAAIWQEIRQFFPGDALQMGMFTTLAGDDLRSARIFTDAGGLLHTVDGGNLLLSLDAIANNDDLMVIATTYNEALSDDTKDGLSGAVFTKMSWVLCDTFSPVTVGVLRDTLGEVSSGVQSSYVQAWPLTGNPGGR